MQLVSFIQFPFIDHSTTQYIPSIMQGIRGASKCHWLVHTTEQEAFSFVIESLCSITVGLWCLGIPQKVLKTFDKVEIF